VRDSIKQSNFPLDTADDTLRARKQTVDLTQDPIFQSLNAGRIQLGQLIYDNVLYKQRRKSPGYRVGYHALLMVARLVVQKVNSNPNISKAALAVLNNSPLLQVHLYTRYEKTDNPKTTGVVLDRFSVVYPPEFSGQLKLSTAKAYWTAGQQGRMTFGFGKADQESL
jgi:hypothetical protein